MKPLASLKQFLLFISLSSLLPIGLQAQGNLPPVGDNWQSKYTNGIAAVVNNEIITVHQLREELSPIVPGIRNKAMSGKEFDKKLEKASYEMLRNLINRELIVQHFNEEGFQIPKVFIEKEYEDYITKEFSGDRMEFHKWLRDEGKTPREFRQELKEKMIVDFMRSRKRQSQSAVSPQRIREYYEQNKDLFYENEAVHLKQIMLKPIANESTDLLIQEARSIIEKIKQGEASFAEMAKKHSEDNNSSKGGDWGWIQEGDLSKKLEKVAFNLEPGEVSEPLIKEGYVFIMKAEDKRPAGVQPLSEVKDQIEQTLAGKMARKAQNQWLTKLRREAYIRYYL